MKPSEKIKEISPVKQLNDPLFIAAILDYLDEEWEKNQPQVWKKCGGEFQDNKKYCQICGKERIYHV